MRDVTRKGFNRLIMTQFSRVGLVAQRYGARTVKQRGGGSSPGAGTTYFLISFFQCFCLVLFCLFVSFF